MTGDRQRFGRLDQPAHQRDIDIPVFRQATKDYAVHLQLLAQFDIQQHRLNLCRCIKEVASTRTDNHIYIDRRSECLRRPDLPVAGCRSSFRDAGTKFHTFCTSGFCFHTALCGVCTNFDNTSRFHTIFTFIVSTIYKDKTIMRNFPIFPEERCRNCMGIHLKTDACQCGNGCLSNFKRIPT